MSKVVFGGCDEKSCAYCLYHKGHLRWANILHRECVGRDCKYLVLFTEHEDIKGNVDKRVRKRFQTYTGDPFDFTWRYAEIIALFPDGDKDEPEADEWKQYDNLDFHTDAHEAEKRRRKSGMKGRKRTSKKDTERRLRVRERKK